jgi:sugar lactone lactonase YvrE
MTTLAGAGTTGSTDGAALVAQFDSPVGIVVNSIGTIYVMDYGSHSLRTISAAGTVTTLAGLGGTSGLENGVGTNARFTSAYFVAVDSNNNAYIGDYGNSALRKVTSSGSVTTVYQSASTPFRGVAFSADGVLYVTTTLECLVSIIATSGAVARTVFAGNGGSDYRDGQGTAASFGLMNAIAFNTAGILFVADQGNFCIRKITTGGKQRPSCAI